MDKVYKTNPDGSKVIIDHKNDSFTKRWELNEEKKTIWIPGKGYMSDTPENRQIARENSRS